MEKTIKSYKDISKLYLGDCLNVMPQIETDSIDAVITDPPYFLVNKSGMGFMGRKWDSLYTSKINSILCKSNEFVDFVARFFALMQVESNTEEENTVQNDVNTEQCPKGRKMMSNANAQFVENHLHDILRTLKVNINSVRGIVLTKAEVLNLLSALSLKNTTVFESLREDVLFVVPISYIIKNLKNTVPISALKAPTKKVCVDKGILLISMEEAKIKSVIDAMTGMKSERSVMLEMNINADTAESTVEEKRYRHIILSHTEKEEVTNYLISLLYVLFVMPELNKSPNSSFKDIQNRDLVYRFHKNWATEALRVLKPGAFAFVMSSPRSDLLPLMITALRDAGFDTNFSSIYWAYNTGFPKAQNISKILDKRAGAKQTVIGHYQHPDGKARKYTEHTKMSGTVFAGKVDKYSEAGRPITIPTTKEAKALDGAYSGMQLKPAVEIVIVAMKPIEERTYMEQALKNGHGCTWLDNCRIPYRDKADLKCIEAKMAKTPKQGRDMFNGGLKKHLWAFDKKIGRFPTNILCENDCMDGTSNEERYSRYYSLEAWFEKYIHNLPQKVQNTFPFLITPKPSVNEKERNLDIVHKPSNRPSGIAYNEHSSIHSERERNIHPTIKPLKLMMWLIVLGTQEGDTVLDPFMGSGTTPMAAKATHRIYKGIELERKFYDIAIKRIDEVQQTIDHFL